MKSNGTIVAIIVALLPLEQESKANNFKDEASLEPNAEIVAAHGNWVTNRMFRG